MGEQANNNGGFWSAAASALPVVGNIVGGFISGYSQKKAQESANRANLELAKYQYQQNLEQWNRENKYNSPIEQMKRYADAGLNPNLIYDQQNTSANSPQMSAPQLMPVTGMSQGLANMFRGIADYAQFLIGLNRQRAEISKLDAETHAIQYSNQLNDYFLEDEKDLRNKGYDYKSFLYQLNQAKEAGEWNYRKEELQKLADILGLKYETLVEKLSVDKANYRDEVNAKIHQMDSAAILNDTRKITEMAKLPLVLMLMSKQIEGTGTLNDLRDTENKNKNDAEGIGFTNGHFNFNMRQLSDLLYRIAGYHRGEDGKYYKR